MAIKYVGGAASRAPVTIKSGTDTASQGRILKEAAGRIAGKAAQVEQLQRERVDMITDAPMRHAVQAWRSKLAG
ncbi:hypothetical protein [Roseicella aquatilis]|uniref:Uncharacterized protein n=1 Tax=Roseicella aquatilis TaxID=2527868 RepID=A0A4R4DQX2_9PROT|nr:hypothetical protein [Roseicella aquatilis]TCZ63618.1 hypothetical protein EXY23_09545 [Roseicella aquatilis]